MNTVSITSITSIKEEDPRFRTFKSSNSELRLVAMRATGQVYLFKRPRILDQADRSHFNNYLGNIQEVSDLLHGRLRYRQVESQADLQYLKKRTSLPELWVTNGSDSGEVLGFLMCVFEDGCRFPQGNQIKSVDWLRYKTEARLERMGFRIPMGTRLKYALDLTRTVGALHSLKIVIGDLSDRNIVLQEKVPHVQNPFRSLIVDCDDFSILGSEFAYLVSDTPDFRAPERDFGASDHTLESDIFKLAIILAIIVTPNWRSYETDHGDLRAASLEALHHLNWIRDSSLVDVIVRALSSQPGERPTAEQMLLILRIICDEHSQRGLV
jgi:hypothetical protein